jgi:hypothetical protein
MRHSNVIQICGLTGCASLTFRRRRLPLPFFFRRDLAWALLPKFGAQKEFSFSLVRGTLTREPSTARATQRPTR